VNILGVIPARLRSTRLPRKALREIGGVPMVVQVFRQASRASVLSDLLVATDSEEIVEACHAHHVPAVMTSADHQSGTDRLWEVSRARSADVYVNIQGDYPTITPGHIERLVRPFLDEPEVQVTTLKIRATRDEIESVTVNKVVTNVHGDALYFSRSPIPFVRDAVDLRASIRATGARNLDRHVTVAIGTTRTDIASCDSALLPSFDLLRNTHTELFVLPLFLDEEVTEMRVP